MQASTRPLDSEVIARAVRGEQAAFEEVIRQFDPSLRLLAARILGPTWSEDALQDAYLKAYRALGRFDQGRGSLYSWLARIVYRACVDEIRRSRRDLLASRGVTGDRAPAHMADVENNLDTRNALANALAGLKEPDRAALVLVDALGFDYETAARVLDLPRGTLASRPNRARTLARAALSNSLEGNDE